MKNFFFAAFCIFSFLAFSCSRDLDFSDLRREEKFSLSYGSFENQINLFNLNSAGTIDTHIAMRDGFFYISNGEAKKVMQFNSYGDLLALYHNPEANPPPLFAESASKKSSSLFSTKKTVSYPFNSPSLLALDFRDHFYVVETLPKERHEFEEGKILRQIVLRFSSNEFSSYIGQEGPGGTPFPFIKNIFSTSDNCLVVVCVEQKGLRVFCYSAEGIFLRSALIEYAKVPEREGFSFCEAECVIPDSSSKKVFVKADYYKNSLASSAKENSFPECMVYLYDLEEKKFLRGIEIPPYEEISSQGFAKQTFKLPYDFIGVAEGSWLFFSLAVDSGLFVQMIQFESGRTIKRHLGYDAKDMVYSSFSLSRDGIISALLAKSEKASVVFWRTDNLIHSIVEK